MSKSKVFILTYIEHIYPMKVDLQWKFVQEWEHLLFFKGNI